MIEVFSYTHFADGTTIYLGNLTVGSSQEDDSGYHTLNVYDSEYCDNKIGMLGFSITGSAAAAWQFGNDNVNVIEQVKKVLRISLPLMSLPITEEQYNTLPGAHFPVIQLDSYDEFTYNKNAFVITMPADKNPTEFIRNTVFKGALNEDNVKRLVIAYALADTMNDTTGNGAFLSATLTDFLLIDSRRVNRAYNELCEEGFINPLGQRSSTGFPSFSRLTKEGRKYLVPKKSATSDEPFSSAQTSTYIRSETEEKLLELAGAVYNTKKLQGLMSEINVAYALNNPHAAHALTRALLDHIAPLFGYTNFDQVTNNHGWSRTDKKRVEHIQKLFRFDADDVLHAPISSKDTSVDMEAVGVIQTTINSILEEAVAELRKHAT